MARADVIYMTGPPANFRNGAQSLYLVKVSATALYAFFISALDNDLYWTKSTDAGISWSGPTIILTGESVQNVSVWYDKWTPGNTGTLIHLAYIENTNDDVLYRALDTSNDSLGTETTIEALLSASTPANACIALTRAIGGNLYCLYDIDGGTEIGFARSTDAGATWDATRADTAEGADYFLLAPGFAADTNDIICIFWDRSANEISRKLYDDSADTWAETSIATSMTAISSATCTPQFAITVDDANNKILLAAWTNRDTLNADLRFWSIDETTITEGTNVVLNSADDQQMCALALDTATGDIYCFYGGKSDGSETAGTSINIYYKVSTDDGTTWGAETLVTTRAGNYDMLFTCPVFTGDFVLMYQATTAGIEVVLNSAVLPAGAGGGQGWW